jgi:hypothetical protein
MKYVLIISILITFIYASDLDSYLKTLSNEVKQTDLEFKGFNIQRGKLIFTSKHIGKKGKEISCTSCHTNNLSNNGENFFTGKKIKPLSPKANPKRLTKLKNIKKWLRRNFKDVYKREGTSLEKGDVLTYIINK